MTLRGARGRLAHMEATMSISALRFDRASRFTALALLAVAAACSKVNETRPSIDLEPLLSPEATEVPTVIDDSIPEEYRRQIILAQTMGKRLFIDDRAAWLAGDVIEAAGLREKYADINVGWQTMELGPGFSDWAVISVGKNGEHFVKFATVTVHFSNPESTDPLRDPGTKYSLSEHPDLPKLEPAEALLFGLRQTALQGNYLRCSNVVNATSYFFRDLDNEEGKDYVVVDIMPGRLDESIYYLGGQHEYRCNLKDDEKFTHYSQTKTCPMMQAEPGKSPLALTISHLNSETPTLFHTFASLDYGLPLYVVTSQNSLLWKVEGSKISLIEKIEDSDELSE